MLRRQDNRVNVTSCTRKFFVFFFVILCTPAVYLIIGPTVHQFQSLDYSAPRDDFLYTDPVEREVITPHLSTPASLSIQAEATSQDTSFSSLIANHVQSFSISDNDVLVFIHIQKTAGTSFEKFLVRHLDIEHPCQCVKGKKRCNCNRPNKPNEIWLFSRYSTGWLCGLHADFTELHVSGCVDRMLNKKEGTRRIRRYFYMTFLREPISRFISEYRHVNRGATWIASRHICNGRAPTSDELPLCFDPNIGWDDVSLNEFLNCPYNLAFNRQTRMLADLTLVDCYSRNGTDSKARDRILLESAKRNLKNMTFFGIKERMDDSQMMFQRLFNMSFNRQLSAWYRSKSNDTDVTVKQLKLIREHNELDIELYSYALKLFNHRLAAVLNRSFSAIKEPHERFASLESKFIINQKDLQLLHNNDLWREPELSKPKNMVLNDVEYETSDDDYYGSDKRR